MAEVYLRLDNKTEPEKGVQMMGQIFNDSEKLTSLEAIEKEVKRLISSQTGNHHHQKQPSTSPRKVLILYIEGYVLFSGYILIRSII